MSHYRCKTKYNTEGSYGSIEEQTLYAHHNLSCDIVSFYDEDGDCILSVDDTMGNNQLDAINRLYSPFAEFKTGKLYEDGIEPMTPEEREMISNRQETPRTPIHFARWILKRAKEHWTKEGLLCWMYKDKEMDTAELYEYFLREE